MMFQWLSIFSRLPDRVMYALSSVLAPVLYHVVRYRRKTVNDNLFKAFPEKSPAERALIAKKFYSHLADVAVEILMLARLSRSQLSERVEIVGMEYLADCVDSGISAILLSAHQGNWEWMLTAVASVSPCPLDALYRPLHNATMDQFFMHVRSRMGAHMIPAEKAARVILKLRNEVRAFGILGDQNPRRRDEKFWVRFMGVETPMVIGPERIARLTGYPLFYVATERLSRGRYRCVISPLSCAPYPPEGEVSQLYADAMENHIRRQPECWMWSHQRWRYTRAEAPE